MKPLLISSLGALVLSFLPECPAPAAEPGYHIEVDYSQAPECEAFALKARRIAEEWYPKIHQLLFGAESPAPARTVRLTFEPMKGIAHATGDGIHISADWVTKKEPEDYGMVVHELTHVVQGYPGKAEFWLTEGIADYVRYEFYEPGKQKWKLDPEKSSYRQGYGVAGAFLAWLEKNKDPQIVRSLNAALHAGQYTPQIFSDRCGAELEVLWQEFVSTRRQP